jgi:hypothetical protein
MAFLGGDGSQKEESGLSRANTSIASFKFHKFKLSFSCDRGYGIHNNTVMYKNGAGKSQNWDR